MASGGWALRTAGEQRRRCAVARAGRARQRRDTIAARATLSSTMRSSNNACGLAVVALSWGALGCGADPGGDGADAGADGAACTPTTMAATAAPVDLLVLLDQSGSMADPVAGGTKWQAVSAALADFAQTSTQPGLRVGLAYFAVAGASGDSCAVADYATPEVELGPVTAAAGAITASLALHAPSTGAPTAPALAGALAHAGAWAVEHPAAAATVALVTDGAPTDCDTATSGLVAIAAAAAAATPAVVTSAIGVGPGLGFLDAVADAGGGAAAQVPLAGDVAGGVRAGLELAVARAGQCRYAVPVGADLAQLNLVLAVGAAAPATVPRVADAAACASGDGWYVEDAGRARLCATSCAAVTTMTARVEVAVGCPTVAR